MLVDAGHLKGLVLRATDGELGTVDQLYFDDETWAIRYFTANTGGCLGGRTVLISPLSVVSTDWPSRRLDVSLTKKQVKESPDIDTQQPVSRQHEAAYLDYYGYPYYWGALPAVSMSAVSMPAALTDSHLRSTQDVTGYRMEAADGELGHVAGFVVDDEAWAIRYIDVATRNWWPGKKVLVSPAWIQRVSWTDSKVFTALTRDAIEKAPEYLDSKPIAREYENRLYMHYGQPPYWLPLTEHQASLVSSGI